MPLALLICLLFIAAPSWAAIHRGGADPQDAQIESQMPANWKACAVAADCQLVAYGCTGFIAANKTYITEATALAQRVGGNPTTINCLTDENPHYLASCLGHQCFATNPTE